MIIAKRYKLCNKYSKHLYISNEVFGEDSRILDTQISLNDANPETTYEVFLDQTKAYIIKDNIKIYLDYTSDQILRYFNHAPKGKLL